MPDSGGWILIPFPNWEGAFGKGAIGLKEFPEGGILGKTISFARTVSRLHIPFRAAYGAYFLILSMFPALLLILSCLRYTGLTVEDLTGVLRYVLPEALVDTADELVFNTYRNATSAVTGVSAITLLWSSSKGVYGLLTGLNAVYAVEESRGYFYTRLISVLYALLFLVILVLTLVLHVFGNAIVDLIYGIQNPLVMFLADLIDLHGILLLSLQTLLFTAVYMVLPNRRNGFWDSLPGAMFSAVGWSAFSTVYSIYVTHFSRISNIYGSVYAVAISMLWLYCCICILFYGGTLNRLIAHWRSGNETA